MEDLYKSEVIDPGDMASKLAKQINVESYKNCPAVSIVPHDSDNFRGPVGYLWNKNILKKLADYKLNHKGVVIDWSMMEEMENDGAGGKPQFFTLIGDKKVFADLGREIIAMTADDFARTGRLPCIIANEMDVKKITRRNFSNFMFLMEGYGKALKEQNLVNITGETAIMKHSITAFCDSNDDSQLILVWGAACIGLASKKLLLNPANIKPGMVIVGFKDSGYGCNGGTFFTNLILRKWGPDINDILENPKAMEFVKKLAVPSKIYAKTVCRILGWKENGEIGEPLAKIAGIAHITGGGVWGKFGEILPPGVGAYLYNMPDPPQVLLEAQELSFEFTDLKLSDHSGYGTLHGGCRMLSVAHRFDDAEKIIYEAAQDGIEAQIVGETNDSGKLRINSKYLNGGILEEELKG